MDWLETAERHNLATEERCKELVGKLCCALGWKVVQDPDMPYVLLKSNGKCGAYGHSWSGLLASFESIAWGQCVPFSDGFPEWAKTCSSLEELAVMIDLCCAAREQSCQEDSVLHSHCRHR